MSLEKQHVVGSSFRLGTGGQAITVTRHLQAKYP
jgi:hypothetical protein